MRLLSAQFDDHHVIATFSHGRVKRWRLLKD